MSGSTPDDDLSVFAARGAPPFPAARTVGDVSHDGARIRFACWGKGPAVILLHGGLGHGGNWGYQVPALVDAGCCGIVIDSRGHGHSTHDGRTLSYELMAADVLAVMDALAVRRAALVGWSDGACTALILGRSAPERVAGVLFFACNMDPSGTKEIDESNPVIGRCFARHARDYGELSATPDGFAALVAAMTEMQRTQPNYSARQLADVRVPVSVVQGEHDEFITRQHAEYLARSIPGAALIILPDVSHFAPLQRPRLFNDVLRGFVSRVLT